MFHIIVSTIIANTRDMETDKHGDKFLVCLITLGHITYSVSISTLPSLRKGSKLEKYKSLKTYLACIFTAELP